MNLTDLILLLAGVIATVFVLAPHEYAHAFVAYKCGDGTAKAMGRLTLNPIKHLDPIGFLCCAFVGFGWAKPVPVNPYNFKNYRRGLFLTANAGVCANYIIAFVAYLVFALVDHFIFNDIIMVDNGMIMYYTDGALGYLGITVCLIFYLIYAYSLSVFVFNLLPLNPLDGFRIVEACTRELNPVRRFLNDYGQMILIILVVESYICTIVGNYADWVNNFNILNYVMNFATEIIGFPIKAAWDWIFAL